MEPFIYAVRATRVLGKDADNNDITGFLFNPTSIVIEIGPKQVLDNDSEVVQVTTTLTEGITGGYNQQVRTQLLPATILAAISGFDTDSMKPVVNTAALGQILASYDLILAS